jgi:PIN domain nuclease of toxin-antitoxin system
LKLLLDTHAALWWLADDARLSDSAARHLLDETNVVLVSAAVVWELAIKRSLGKLKAPDDFGRTLLAAGALPLAIGIEHAVAVEGLPWHHRDPFDRLLVAQASVEGATIVSHDEALRAYAVPIVW